MERSGEAVMTDSNGKQSYSLAEAHKYFAISYHQEVWQLLEKKDRSSLDNERMIHAAHASCRHWLEVGEAVNQQRGEWMISHAYSVTGQGSQGLKHAERCLAITFSNEEQVKDFDWSYAYESVARAHVVLGQSQLAKAYWKLAKTAGEKISDEQDKKVWDADFEKGPWQNLETVSQ
jgi:hypothetical protein